MGKIEVIGVMSGTSLDGLDLCHVIFNLDNLSDFKIANSTTISYPKKILEKLNNIVKKNIDQINKIDIDYGTFIGETINNFISSYNLNLTIQYHLPLYSPIHSILPHKVLLLMMNTRWK